MKKISIRSSLIFVLAFAFLGTLAIMPAVADDSATVEVFYKNNAIDIITISVPSIPTMEVTSYPDAGGTEGSASDTSATYDITTNAGADARKITGALNSDMETDLTLTATLVEPAGAVSEGEKTLSSAPAVLVTGIDNGTFPGLGITLKFTAKTTAAITSSSKLLTLTLTAS